MQLGRESISNSIVAILELVKNSYDADAETVTLRFAHLGTPNSILVIEDTGKGMTPKQLRQDCLLIGTDNKRKQVTSGKGHILTGEKGLGQLGRDRLCRSAILRSFTAKTAVELQIDWSKYDRLSSKALDWVKHGLYKIDRSINDPITGKPREITKGTQIILEDLRDDWTKELLVELKKELTLLISPFGGINDFAIEINSGMGWQDIDGQVNSSEMLEAAEWQFTALIADDKKHMVSYSMYSPRYKKRFAEGPKPWDGRFPKSSASIPG